MASSEFHAYAKSLESSRSVQDELRKQYKAAEATLSEAERRQVIGRINATERDFRREADERMRLLMDWATFRRTALSRYAQFLAVSPSSSSEEARAAFRIVGLWFSRDLPQLQTMASQLPSTSQQSVADMLEPLPEEVATVILNKVPSRALLPVFPQLLVR